MQISQIGADFGYFSPKNQRFQRLSASHFDFSDSLLELNSVFIIENGLRFGE